MATPARERFRLRFDHLAIVAFFAALFARAAHQPAQNDTWWQLRAGKDIWRGLWPTTERWTFTFRGRFWPDHEWLSQAIFYALHSIGGMPLLTMYTAAVVTAAFAVFWSLMDGPVWRRLVLFVATIPATLITSAVRPQVVSILLLAVVTWLIQSRRFRVLPLVFLLWANLHGAVVAGGVVVVAALISAALFEPAIRRRLAIATGLSGLATMFTPLGPRVISLVLGMTGELNIEEWRPAWQTEPAGAFLLVVGLLFAVSVRQLARSRSLDWRNRSVVAGAIGLLPLAIRYSRVIPMFVLLALVVVARAWASWRPAPARHDEANVINSALATLAVIAALVWTVGSWAGDDDSLEWHPLPAAAVDAARACGGNLYNRFDDGGYLNWFAQDIPNFVDGRVDPFPKSFLKEHFADEKSGDYVATFARWHVTCALLPPQSPTAGRLAEDHWRVLYFDGRWVVLQASG